MADGKAEISIDRSPDDIWKVIRQFGTIDEWRPGVESCSVDGDVRTIGMMGIEVKEQLRELDDDARRISYSLIESPIGNLEAHLVTIAVDPEGAGSHLAWSVTVTPDELLGLFLPLYEGSVAALKQKFES